MNKLFFSGKRLNRTSYLLPFLSGLLLIPAFPPLEQGYLAWFALMPLVWFSLHALPRQALVGGFVYGLPLNLYLNLYLVGILLTNLSPVLAVGLLVLITSCFNALFALAAAYVRRQGNGLGFALALPSLWLLIEYARSVGFLGYNVGYLGYTQ